MFRQREVFIGGWHDKTVEAMHRRRFEQIVAGLQPLGAERLEALPQGAFSRKLEHSWQDFEIKPMRTLQMNEVWKCVLGSMEKQADCLSQEEHSLVERALILGGSVRIEDMVELEAARALSLRLWANVGLISGKPYMELEKAVMRPAARAFARKEHEQTRRRLSEVGAYLSGILYRKGMMDDRLPQKLIVRDVLGASNDELCSQLARRYLWASFDCVDYQDGVMLIHPALADPYRLINRQRRVQSTSGMEKEDAWLMQTDILPEEVPLQKMLEDMIQNGLRAGVCAQDVARNIRFLCKQGAPLCAMEEMLQEALIVCISPSMRWALRNMYDWLPKWVECTELGILQ